MSGKDCFKIIAVLLSIYFYECVLLETLILQLDKQTIVENGNLTLTCTGDLTSINGASIFVPNGSNDSVLVTKNQKGECVAHTIKSYIPQCHNDSSFSLTLLNVSNTQHGEVWYCEPWLLNGRSNSIHLSVKVPVKNVTMSLKGVKQPTILRCVENESLSLECNSSFGRPPPSITWLTGASYSDASAVTTMEIKPVLYNASDETYNYTQSYLTLNVSRTFNNKSIFCNATNLPDAAPVSSNYFTFDVHYPPVVEPIENSSIIEMNNFTTLCRQKVNGNPANTTVTWTRNKILESTDQYLNFIKVLRNNEGYYTCSARNVMQYSNGSTVDGVGSTSFYLSVMYPPDAITVHLTKDKVQFKNITDKFNVTQGSIVTLGCSANSRPPPSSYTWSGMMSASEENITINVTKNLSGNLICTARNTMTVIPGNINTTGTNNKTYSMNVQYPPEIGNIQNITVVEFGKVNYTCPVTRGNPSETNYIWTRIGDNTKWRSEELLIDHVLRSHEGFYTFNVSNIMRPIYISEEQGVSYKMLYITVLYPPEGFRVTYNADNVSRELISDTFNIIEGTNLTLSCSADSNPSALNNSWSGPMTSVNNKNLTLYVTKGHSGNYTCSVNNLMTESPGSTTIGSSYTTFHMEVLYPPKVNQLENMTAIEGTPFNLNCSFVYGNPNKTTINWIREKDNKSWYSRTMSIGNITRSDDSIYTCIANNTLSPTYGDPQIGLSSQNVYIQILYPPEVKLTDRSIIEGEDVSISCVKTPGKISNQSISWISHHTNVTNNNSLIIRNVTRKHAGNCTCVINYIMIPTYGESTLGSIIGVTYIDVLYKAELSNFFVVQNDQNIRGTVNESDHVRMICKLDSNPSSTMQISVRNQTVSSGKLTKILEHSISKTRCNDTGVYRCSGYNFLNKNGYLSWREIKLLVTCSPRQSSSVHVQQNVTVQLNDLATLRFNALAYPLPVFKWWRRTNSILSEANNGNSNIQNISENELQIEFVITNVASSDFGEYVLTINNNFGYHQESLFLFQKDTTPTEQNHTETDVTGPVTGGIIGSIIGIVAIVCAVVIFRSRVHGKQLNAPNNSTSLNLSQVDQYQAKDGDCSVTADSDISNVYEQLQSAGSDQQYQQLTLTTTPLKDNTGGDCTGTTDGGISNVYEKLHNAGSDQPYQQLNTFGIMDNKGQSIVYENLRIHRNTEGDETQ